MWCQVFQLFFTEKCSCIWPRNCVIREEYLTKAVKFGGHGSGGNSSFQLTWTKVVAALLHFLFSYMNSFSPTSQKNGDSIHKVYLLEAMLRDVITIHRGLFPQRSPMPMFFPSPRNLVTVVGLTPMKTWDALLDGLAEMGSNSSSQRAHHA